MKLRERKILTDISMLLTLLGQASETACFDDEQTQKMMVIENFCWNELDDLIKKLGE